MSEQLRKTFLRYSSIVGGTFALIWFGFWEYCYQVGSRFPDQTNGRVFDINYHGTIIYLSQTEYYILYAIPVTGLLIGVISALIIKLRA
jgi:hypothetical protein